ncbi:cyclic peptide export ABC transporter [Tenacibaculum aiptasiae]|uniref:Cyclic peptide export ABC transporter n=1 Tax=Tenacibaculum aiptasiae TaxID=426481 RepID=A0A7J5A7W8_9FLAO|nr:cyclic peptide export ABC transporter [Tenacibaculum aiptasiae]KAB1153656.1 cyclic peptide export ABC transporter [Tenacibaculum aiptasiae]
MDNTVFAIQIFIVSLVIIGVTYTVIALAQILQKKRTKDLSFSKFTNYLLGFVAILPISIFLYYMPIAMYDENFWMVQSQNYKALNNAIIQLGIAVAAFYFLTRVTMFFPHKNKYYNILSSLLLISLIPGVANSLIVMIISQFVSGEVETKYLLTFFVLATYFYVITIRLSKRKTAYLGSIIAQEFNSLILRNVFRIPFQKYEKIQSGKIYTILNDDIGDIFYFSQVAIHIFTNVLTAVIIFIYLFSLDFLNASVLVGSMAFIFFLYSFLAAPLNNALLDARDKREGFTNLVSGLINGFKELVLHQVKRVEYNKDMEVRNSMLYTSKLKAAYIDINKTLLSEISFTVAVGVTCLVFPMIFEFDKQLITTFVIGTLFLWGPFNNMLSGIPGIINAKIAWRRIKEFLKNTDSEKMLFIENDNKVNISSSVESLEVQDICFNYKRDEDSDEITYGIGPINFEVRQGDIVFIIGGNGSGKTTFLKTLIGLYPVDSGQVLVNGERVDTKVLGEHYSVIYSDFYLFKKIYGINTNRLNQVYEWLDMFGLSDKVTIEDGAYSTIDLSKGQRKRLAILKSYLEDRPIYFFDECAADLDPDFKDFFYNELLVKMRDEGKLLIVITHDDKYFDLANKVYKMEMGKISMLKSEAVVL